MTAVGTTSGPQSGARLVPGLQLGEYRLGAPLWPLRVADAYKADGPRGPATIFVIHAKVAGVPAVRDQIIAGTRHAAALPDQPHVVKTLAAGLTGDILWIATDAIDGSLVRDVIAHKRKAGGTGALGLRATGKLIAGIAAALADVHHGVLADESVTVDRVGNVKVLDLALAPGIAAAMRNGLIPGSTSVAPEIAAGGPATGAADVYALGALLYECLSGMPLERGGPRPSEVIEGVTEQIDELVARACHRDPAKRFGRTDVLGEVVAEALSAGGALHADRVDRPTAPPLTGSFAIPSAVAVEPPVHAAPETEIDRALAVALGDPTERWLVSKGKLDYGPFSLSQVMALIDKGELVTGNMLMDKDTGARTDVGTHPLLGPRVETTRMRIDDARRAQAEVAVQSREKTRGVMLYGLIALGVLGAGGAVYLIIKAASSDSGEKEIKGVAKLEGAALKVTVSMPKEPPKRASSGGGRRGGGGGGGGNYTRGSEDLALDMSGDDDSSSATLDMGTVYKVYSRHGGQLGGCLQRTGAGSASLSIIIDGPSGRVSFVKVDGKQSGATWACLNGVMRSMKFPTLSSGRTRAEFDIGI